MSINTAHTHTLWAMCLSLLIVLPRVYYWGGVCAVVVLKNNSHILCVKGLFFLYIYILFYFNHHVNRCHEGTEEEFTC